VVFLCDTARQFNKQDSRDTVLVHPKLGLGPKLTDLERRVQYPTLARNAIKLRQERELLSEEMRLLYVALTRPKERLYISAAMKSPEASIEKARLSLSKPMAPQRLAAAAAPFSGLFPPPLPIPPGSKSASTVKAAVQRLLSRRKLSLPQSRRRLRSLKTG